MHPAAVSDLELSELSPLQKVLVERPPPEEASERRAEGVLRKLVSPPTEQSNADVTAAGMSVHLAKVL